MSEANLRDTFDQMEDELLLNRDHDMARGAVGRMFNKRFVTLDNGYKAILADIEIQDDVDVPGGSGISYTFKKRTYSRDLTRRGDLAVVVNSDVFNIDSYAELVRLSDSGLQVDVVEIEQRSLETVAILIVKFVVLSVVSKFVGDAATSAGKALVREIKARLDQKLEREQVESVLQIHCEIPIAAQSIPAVLEIGREDLVHMHDESVSVEDAVAYVQRVVGSSNVSRVFLRLAGSPPKWTLVHFIDSDGRTVTV